MKNYKYRIYIGEILVGVVYDDQLIDAFVRGLFDKYYKESDMTIKIQRYDDSVKNVPVSENK